MRTAPSAVKHRRLNNSHSPDKSDRPNETRALATLTQPYLTLPDLLAEQELNGSPASEPGYSVQAAVIVLFVIWSIIYRGSYIPTPSCDRAESVLPFLHWRALQELAASALPYL